VIRSLRFLPAAVLCFSLVACGDGDETVTISLFQGAPDSIEQGQSTKLVFVVEPEDARVSIEGLGDVTGRVDAMVTPAATTTYRLTATKGDSTASANATVTVGPATAATIKVEPALATPAAGDELSVTVTAIVGNGTTAPGFRGTVKLTSTDPQAVLPPDLVFAAADAGVKQVKVTLKTAGLSTLTGTDVASPARRGTASVTVQPAGASTFALSTLASPAVAGQSLVLTITARDRFGNVATTFAGQAQVVSTDATDVLPGPGAFAQGVRTVSLVFRKAGSHVATVQEVGGPITADTNAVVVGPAAPSRIAVAAANAQTIAGTEESFTLTVFDAFDNIATNYLGTVHFATTANADLPADHTFVAGDAGTRTFAATLKSAGTDTITMTDTVNASLSGANSWEVAPAAVATYELSSLPSPSTAGQALLLTITARDAFANLATNYAGLAQVISGDATDILPAPGGFIGGVRTVNVTFRKAGNHSVTAQEVEGSISASSNTIAVGPAAPFRIAVAAANAQTVAGTAEPFTLTVFDVFDNIATNYVGTVHFATTANVDLPADHTFVAGDAGTRSFAATLKSAGIDTITMTDTVNASLSAANSWQVAPAAVIAFELSSLPSPSTAGQALLLTITARDTFGNLATNYAGQAQVISGDVTDVLPATGGFTAGVRTVNVTFRKSGSHFVSVQEVGGEVAVSSNTITVRHAAPFRISVAAANPSTIAGTAESFTLTVLDFFDNIATEYLGTVHFATTANAELPADYTFELTDAGSHTFSATLKSAGTDTITISDVADAALTGFNSWLVGPADATRCTVAQAPPSARAGSVVGVAVTLHDPFDNLATTYTGTIRVSSTDARATLPAAITYEASDAGSHAFSASLRTAGAQTLSAEDVANPAIHCDAPISILPGAARIVLNVPNDANAGFGVNVGVAITDEFDNAVTDYAGIVTFASTDSGAGAVTPAPITFTGSEGGVATAAATFVTLGAQTLTATDNGEPAATGTAASSIHGLVYTAPTSGKVRLVANAAQSNAQVVQLDLVANERLEVSSFFGGGPGPHSAGMNLPLDTNRAVADATLFTSGNAFLVGNPPVQPTGIGRIGETDHVLYTAVSRRRVVGTVFTQLNEVLPGRVFYSIRLRLTQNGTVGPVFDGAQPSPLFRAAVRDQFGDDFVPGSLFGIGKLEIR
jgi:hypothetical protein